MHLFQRLSLLSALFLSSLLLASSIPGAPQYSDSLELDTSIATRHFDSLPYGFTNNDVAPVQSLVFNFGMVTNPNATGDFKMNLWGRFNASFILDSLVPILGAQFGPRFDIGNFSLLLAPELQLQDLVSSAPFNTSQYSIFWYGFLARVAYDAGFIVPSFEAKVMSAAKTKISEEEGLDTYVDHNATWRVTPEILGRIPGGLRASLGLDAYSLGTTAIASKTFAYAMEKTNIVRYHAGLGFQSGDWEAWLHYYWVTNVKDPVANDYQAPYLFEEYCLSPQFATLEVKWSF